MEAPRIPRSASAAVVPIASQGVDLSAESDAGGTVFHVKYTQRLPQVGVLQGPWPLSPGERFSIAIRSLGTFGKIGLGLAPWRSEGSPGLQPRADVADERDERSEAASVPTHQTSAMVGWCANEIGFHGDHGRWYCMGSGQGKQVTPPWEEGDVLECGLTRQGSVYFLRNGSLVVSAKGYWPIAHAYPTVTFHSSGAELSIGLSDVLAKSLDEFGAAGRLRHRPALDLLDAFRRTAAEAPAPPPDPRRLLRRWLGLCCAFEVAPPDGGTRLKV